MQMCGSDFPEKSALMIHPLVQGPFKSPGLILLLGNNVQNGAF